jgi:hypothetical protein
MIGVMNAIAVLIVDMIMVAMIVAKMTMTTSAAILRVMGHRSRRGDVGGGITREAMKMTVLDKGSRCECIITFPSLLV